MDRREAALLRRRLREHDADVLRLYLAGEGDENEPPPPPPLKTTLSVRVDYDTLAALDALADRDGVLPTALARDYIKEGIARDAAPADPLAQLALAARLLLDAQARLIRPR